MKRFMQKEEENLAKARDEQDVQDQEVEVEADSSSDSESGARKIGDKLFDEDNDKASNKITSQKLREYAKDMDPKLL